jgi:Na+/proline symporter
MDVEYILWFSLTLISFFAVLFLPRQFHVIAVENSDENHLKKAMWLFPLYLLLINIFVPAIAWAAALIPGLRMLSCNYTLLKGQDALSLFVFIGGTGGQP